MNAKELTVNQLSAIESTMKEELILSRTDF